MLITTILSFISPIFDAIGSIMVGLLLVIVSYKLSNEIRKLIVGESIPRSDRKKIKDIINEYDIVEHINKVQTMVIGNDKYMVLISIGVNDDSTGYKIEDTIDQIKIDIIKEIPQVKVIYVDVKDPNRSLVN